MLDSLKSLLDTDRSSAKDSERLVLVRRERPGKAAASLFHQAMA
jgi:hypothetical protein